MDIKNKKILSVIIIVATICLSALIVTAAFAVKAKKESPDEYILSCYENNVALFVNGQLKEVYPEITLDALPKQDIDQLTKGLLFANESEAISAIEDYDG